VLGEGVGSGDGVGAGLDLDGAVAAEGRDELPDRPAGDGLAWVQGFKKGFHKTLTQLLFRLDQQTASDQQLIDDLDEARKRRNYLAHAFWRDHGAAIVSRVGREGVIRKLEADEAFFREVRERLSAVSDRYHEQLGFTQDMFDEEFRQLYREATE
jgi:hypothetical protein